jgi:hypothetical protein
MDAYEQLKEQARKKRDAALKRIRANYQATVAKIDALRTDLDGYAPAAKAKKAKPILEMVCDLMPRDRGFTFADIHRLLLEACPGREFNELTIRTLLPKLEAQGILRRVTKNQQGRVVWAAAGAVVQESPFGAMATTDVAELILRESGPMMPAELVVAIQDRGHRTDASPRQLLASLRTAVQRYPGRFLTGEDGRWTAAI